MPAAAASRTGQPRPARPRIGISSCLLGEQVRYNGRHSRCRFLTDELGAHADWVPCCPEMAIGLGSPRETLRLTTAALPSTDQVSVAVDTVRLVRLLTREGSGAAACEVINDQAEPLTRYLARPSRQRVAAARVAVSVHRRTGGFTRDRPRALVQVEPI